jgi:methyltransferase family protein
VSPELRHVLLTEPPKFHFWDGEAQVGGFDARTLETIERTLVALGAPESLTAYETGAGLSSAWMLGLGVGQLYSFFLEPELGTRIEGFLREHQPEAMARWRPHVGPSELNLPLHVAAMPKEEADFCLIDGGHALQTVIVDFVYLHYALKRGGVLVVDDLQLGSCGLLLQMLTDRESLYGLIERTPKTAFLKKVTEKRLLPDWGAQAGFLDRISKALGTP